MFFRYFKFKKKLKKWLNQQNPIAIKYLCIPATSVPFSKAEEIMSKKRNRKSVKHVNNLIFLSFGFYLNKYFIKKFGIICITANVGLV